MRKQSIFLKIRSLEGFSAGRLLCISILIMIFLVMNESISFAQSADVSVDSAGGEKWNRMLPFGADWALEQGIELPLPVGVSGFYTFMSRDVEVTDVTVEFQGRKPESISDFASFAVRNKTSVYAAKLDAWILPVLNLYALSGFASNDSNMKAQVTIDRSILPLPPVEIDIDTNSIIEGPYLGCGATLVAGYKNWFVMADANYGQTWPDLIDNYVNFTFLSARSGFSGAIGGNHTFKAWLGAAYLYSRAILEIKEQTATLGEVIIRIEQQPVNPWTVHCGWILGVSRQFELMVELGTNFDDAGIAVASAAYRL